MTELIQKLKSLGFNEYESKIFIALIKGHNMSVPDIAKSANIRRTDVYDIMKSFVEKGYCNEIETNTVSTYIIIDPAVLTDKIARDFSRINEQRIILLREICTEAAEVCGYGKNSLPEK